LIIATQIGLFKRLATKVVKFDDELKLRTRLANNNFDDKFEKSNRSRRIRNSRHLNLTIDFEKSNRATNFEKSNLTINFEKSNRATKRKTRIRNSNRKFDDKLERETRIRNSTRRLRNLTRNATHTKKLHGERQTNDEKLTHTKHTHARTKQHQNAHQRHTLQMSGCNIKYAFFLFKNNLQ